MKEKPNQTDSSNIVDLRKLDSPINSLELIKSIVSSAQNVEKDPFYIVDLEDICNKHINWITRLPRVEPHYAVKCNTDSMLLKLLAFLGAGFDCASKNEIQRVLDMGVAPHRIIFANPCKQASNIKYACKMGVEYMTFDNENELYKIKEHHPQAKCVLRIITNDEDAVCRFSMKFGADMDTSLKLIETAVELGIDLVGVSFHVGSGQMSPKAFVEAIRNARQLFDYAREHYSLKFHLLDLGGGYPGSAESGDFFSMIAREINTALETYFPADFFAQINGPSDDNKLKIIAEPGRYYACSAFSLCVSIIAKRVMNQSASQQKADKEAYAHEGPSTAHAAAVTSYMCSTPSQLTADQVASTLDASKSMMYYVNDGVYASFNCLFYDHADCLPVLVDEHHSSDVAGAPANGTRLYKSSIWGPTCDGLDVVVKECLLPELVTEEYMMFKNMGAYTLSGAVAFNGIPLARCIYVASNSSWDTIKDAFEDTIIVDSSTFPMPMTVSSVSSGCMGTPVTAASCSASAAAAANCSSLPSTAAKMSNASCAAVAHLHARSISLQLDELHINSNNANCSNNNNNNDSCAASDEEVDMSKDGHLIGDVAEAKDDLDVECAITC